jgi:hypothetical protein
MSDHEKTGVADVNTRLLRALAEELKLPLLQIARQAELGKQTDTQKSLQIIETTADATLALVDSYLLTTQILLQQQALELQPVSVTAALYDSAQHLQRLSKLYNAKVDIEVHGKCGQAMAHPAGLQAALTALAYSFMSGSNGEKKRIIFFANKCEEGISTGVVSTKTSFNSHDLETARRLYGNAHQPAASISSGSGAGVYIADQLFAAMASSMRVTRQRKSAGLLATLLPNQQLALL